MNYQQRFSKRGRLSALTGWIWSNPRVATTACVTWYATVMLTGLGSAHVPPAFGQVLAGICLVLVVLGIAEVCLERGRHD